MPFCRFLINGCIGIALFFFATAYTEIISGNRGLAIFFLLIEAITRRKLNWKAEAIMNGVVLILLLVFMLVVTANDIWRLIK